MHVERLSEHGTMLSSPNAFEIVARLEAMQVLILFQRQMLVDSANNLLHLNGKHTCAD
jgi:hypothetical protein